VVGTPQFRTSQHLVNKDKFHTSTFGLVKSAEVPVKGPQKSVKREVKVSVCSRKLTQKGQFIRR